MTLLPYQVWIYIGLITLGTMITRFLPFLVFPESKEPPKAVMYLSRVLPPAVMALLTVYCLRNTTILTGSHGLPELISVAFIVVIHKWKNNVLLSILGGTVCYMLLINFVF